MPDLGDAKAVENWHAAVIELSYERGEVQRLEGRREGEAVGEARGRARAIVDVLTRRGLTLRDLESARILCRRDEAKLARCWELAWTVTSVDELWDEPGA